MPDSPGTLRALPAVDRFATAFLVVLVVALPWPLGGRLPWVSMLAVSAVIVVSVLWIAGRLFAARSLPWHPILLPVAGFLAWIGIQAAAGWTEYLHATLYEWVRYLSYGLVLLLTLGVARTRSQARRLGLAVIAAGLAVGVFALVQFLTWNGSLFWLYEPPYGGLPFGPFNNKNYFAGFMLVTLAPAIAMLLTGGLRTGRTVLPYLTWLGGLALLMSLSRGAAVAFAAMLLLLLGIGLRRGSTSEDGETGQTQARTAKPASRRPRRKRRARRPARQQPFWIRGFRWLVSDAAPLRNPTRPYATAQRGHRWRIRTRQLRESLSGRAGLAVVAVGMVLALFLGLAWLGQLDRVFGRLETLLTVHTQASFQTRVGLWSDTLTMIADRPIVGSGLNTFGWVFPRYRSEITSNVATHAHSEYLEMVAETGLVGGILCLAFIAMLLGGAWRCFQDADDSFGRGIRLGGIAAWTGTLVYGLTDFPTIIPAIDYTLAVLAGLMLVDFDRS